MNCEDCPYKQNIRGLVNRYQCSQRPGSRNGHEGCDLYESIKNGNRNRVDQIFREDSIDEEAETIEIIFEDIDEEAETIEIDTAPFWPYDSDDLLGCE